MKKSNRHKFAVVFFINIFFIVFLSGQNTQKEPDFLDFFKNFSADEFLKTENNLEGSDQINKQNNSEKKSSEFSQKVLKEFEEYKSKFYVKVFSVREKFFEKMTSDSIEVALKEIIEMLSDKPWIYVETFFKKALKLLSEQQIKEWKESNYDMFYIEKVFKNKELIKWFKSGGGFWEFIADQLSFYNEFLEMAKIDLNTKIIEMDKNYFWNEYNVSNKNNKIKLKDYWNKNGVTVHHDFYALCFDYWVKLFLEGILNQDLQQATRYYEDLRITMDKLLNTSYACERQENVRIYKELLDILKQKKQKVDLDNSSSDGGYFNELMEFYDID